MDRNDQILASALGMALFAVVLLAIALNAPAATAPEWALSFLTLVAIVAAISVPLHSEKRRREEQQGIAEIGIASLLRSWLRIAAKQVFDNLEFTGTGGQEGERQIQIPALHVPLDRVAAMRSSIARDVLSLLEERERSQGVINWEHYRGDDSDGLAEYYERISRLFWKVRGIYGEIASARGLEETVNRGRELEAIRHAEQKARDYRRLENTII